MDSTRSAPIHIPGALSHSQEAQQRSRRTRASRGRRGKGAVPVPAEYVLNFSSYEPTRDSLHSPARSRPNRRRSQRFRRREQFVQANCRFAINPELAPCIQDCLVEADAPLEWNAVDLVFVERNPEEEAAHNCPICLQNLRCPKITPCGHVFDHVCILQYLHYAEASSAKCPLCSTWFDASSLKSVDFRMIDAIKVGSNCVMRLISSTSTSTITLPQGEYGCHQIPSHVNAKSELFTRFVFASDDYLLDLLRSMANDLRSTLSEEPSLKPFVNEAMKGVEVWKQDVRRRRARSRHMELGVASVRNEANCALSWKVGADAESSSPSTDSEMDQCSRGAPAGPLGLRLFYQSSDAQNVYLHPVNHRCLLHEYENDLLNAPLKIEGTVLDVERHTMDDGLRKRYRFLKHLPEGCEFVFVELDLKNLLSPQCLAHFESELKGREVSRRRRKKESERESRRVDKLQTDSLHDYFGIAERRQGDLPVDRNDESSFPALGMDTSAHSQVAGSSPEETTTVASPGSAWGGAEISSYSSVTSSMGLFPALGSTPFRPPSPPRGAWGGGQAGSAVVSGISNSATSQPRSESRRNRKHHGRHTYTLLLSNGTPYRR